MPAPPPPPLTITTSSLPNASYNAYYSLQLNGTGGVPPYTWSATGTPQGMTVGSGGLLFGTPSVPQVFHLVVHLNDSASGSVLGYLDLTVTRGGTLTVSGTTAPAPASAGQTVTFYANGSGGTPGYAYQWSGAVAGTGQSLGFTPPSSGVYTAMVTVTDSLSHTSGTSVSVNVGGGAGGSVTIITGSLPNGSVGVNYSAPLSASGGTGTYTWSVASGSSLPAWLHLSSSGVLSGTPTTATTYNFTIQVNDSASATTSKAFSLTVAPAGSSITANPTSQSTVQGGSVEYPLTISGFGGTVALSASGLPAGASAAFSPSSVTGSGSSVLTLATNKPNTLASTYPITLTGTSGSSSAQTTVTLTVTMPGATPSSTTLIPFGWVSPAETLMFTSNTNSTSAPWYFSVVIENAGIYAASGNVVATNACYIQYLAPDYGNVLTLGNDHLDGTYWVNPGGTVPGRQGQISNSQCTLDISRSWVQRVGAVMTLQLALTFNPSWSGVNAAKEMFVDTGAADGSSLLWTNRGSWTVPRYSRVPVTTDHYDVFRTGATVHENLLTPQNAGQVQLLGQIPITDGCVWAQPLYAPQVTITTGSYPGVHNILYVATANATVYAYDADKAWDTNDPMYGHFLWSRNLGTPPAPHDDDIFACSGSESNPPSQGNAGIVGTPVLDLSSNIIYVAANLQTSGGIQHQIFGIDASTGLVKAGPTVITDGGGAFQAVQQLQRPGLLLADYSVLVGYGSYADHTKDPNGVDRGYQGWMFSFNRSNLAMLDDWRYSPAQGTSGGASIWMSGGGPAFDGSRVYFATGNNIGPIDTTTSIGLSNSLLQVNPYGSQSTGLGQIEQFLPSQAPSWVGNDTDLGSSRVILVPGSNFVVAAGKSGNVYVVDRTFPISGSSPNTSFTGSTGLIYASFASWNKTIYTWGNKDVLKSSSLNGALNAQGTVSAGDVEQAAVVSVSSCYDQNGLVWTVMPDSDVHSFAAGELVVYDAGTLIVKKQTSLLNTASQPANAMKFTAPLVANGRVYVVTMSQEVLVYGIPGQSGQTAPACVGIPPA